MSEQERIGSQVLAGVQNATTAVEKQVYLRAHIDRLDGVVSKLDDASSGLHNLANRLLGSTPPDDAKGAGQEAPDGIIGECQDREALLESKADQILFALTRLNQVA